jgi:hypothetical protein
MSKYPTGYKVREYQLLFIKGQERHYVSQRSVNYSIPFHKVLKIFFIDTKIGGTTLSIMTLSLMTLSIMTLSIMTLSIMTASIMTLSIMTLSITTASIMLKCYTQLKKLSTMTVNVECHYTMSLC